MASPSGAMTRLTGDLVPNIVDRRARDHPDMLYAEYPVSTLSYDQGYRRITYGDFANAINGLASWLQENLGPGQDFEALAYIGPNDLRYPALILGAAKAGYTMFLPSPRNSVAAQTSLLDRVKCKTLLTPSPRPPAVTAILEAHDIRTVEVPEVSWLLDRDHPHFTYAKTFPEALKEPFFTVHTSGSTGLPKPLVYTHATAATNSKMFSLDPPAGFDSLDRVYQGKRVFITFPPFHGAYLVSHLFNSISFGTVMIAPTSGAIPTAQGLVDGLKKTPADVAFIVPSIVQELALNPELLDYCVDNLEAILYCGGDLPKSIGDTVAAKIRLYNQFGASELGLTAQILSQQNWQREDWKYAQFHPDIGVQLRESADNMYELYAVRNDGKKDQQPTFTIFPDAQEYGSRDLFVHHPSKAKSDLWSWQARADDIIVFLNGEKTNPISMEQHIVSRRPEVAAALVVGAQRFQAALLVEPAKVEKELTPTERATFIEKIWPAIEEANKDAPSHARISKSHILLTQPQKPMLRAGKGTVQKSGTLRLYADAIQSLYEDADTMNTETGDSADATVSRLDKITVTEFVKNGILDITKWQHLQEDDNIFTAGMDSLQALLLVRKLRRGLTLPSISPPLVYTNPSLTSLTDSILRLSSMQQETQTSRNQERSQRLDSLLGEYRQEIQSFSATDTAFTGRRDKVVLLTGSTGALGSYILRTLLADSATHVHCLNRAADSLALQKQRNKSYGLATQLDPSRVTFLTANLSQDYLGLSHDTYQKLLGTATHIIHNAWPVNFNLSLASFRPQLDGLVNLVRFSATSRMLPKLFFISSISSVMSYESSSEIIPEKVIFEHSAPGPNGYAESKYISELLLDHAVHHLSINIDIARVGQIAGPIHHEGQWNKAEWFPSMIISSLHLGALPDTLGPAMGHIDWVPIDELAEVLVDLALSIFAPRQHDESGGRGAQVFHPLNPHPTTWQAIRPAVAAELSSIAKANNKEPVQIVSLSTWLQKVRKDAESSAGSDDEKDLENRLKINPAAKLLEFYEDVLGSKKASQSWEMGEMVEHSTRIRQLKGIQEEWVRKWVRQAVMG